MADQKPTFMTPNKMDSIGSASAPNGSKPGPQEMPGSPAPNTMTKNGGDVAGSSPNKPAPNFMGG